MSRTQETIIFLISVIFKHNHILCFGSGTKDDGSAKLSLVYTHTVLSQLHTKSEGLVLKFKSFQSYAEIHIRYKKTTVIVQHSTLTLV